MGSTGENFKICPNKDLIKGCLGAGLLILINYFIWADFLATDKCHVFGAIKIIPFISFLVVLQAVLISLPIIWWRSP